jgi:hypothetical protein
MLISVRGCCLAPGCPPACLLDFCLCVFVYAVLAPTGVNVTGVLPNITASLSQISFSPDGSLLLVTVRRSTDGVLVYPISGGVLAATPQAISPRGSRSPFGFVFGPKDASGNLIVLATDPMSAGFDVFTVNTVNGSSPTAASIGNFALPANSAAPCWAMYSSATGTYFTVNAGSSSLSQVGVDSSTLAATVYRNLNLSLTGALLDGAVLSYSATQDFAYVIAPGARVVAQIAISGSSLSVVGTVNLPSDATLSIQGAAVYNLFPVRTHASVFACLFTCLFDCSFDCLLV